MVRIVGAAAVSLGLLAGACDGAPEPSARGAAPPAAAASAAPGSRLAQVFDRDMLGAEIVYLETITGPAWQAGPGTRRYKLDSCLVEVAVDRGTVAALTLENVSPQCTFAVAPFTANAALPEAHRLTFGDLKGTFTAECLRDCGNASDPFVYLDWSASRADGPNDIRLGVRQVEGPVLAATDRWGAEMIRTRGEDYVSSGRFNCPPDPAFQAAAAQAFAEVPVTWVRISRMGAAGRDLCTGVS